MKVKHSLLKALAQVGYTSAIKAAGTASQYGVYQATEPHAVSITRIKKNA